MIYSESLAGNASAYRCKSCSCSLCGRLAIRLVWIFDYIWQVHACPSGPRRCWGHLGPFWLQQGECGLNKKKQANILGWNGCHGCQFVSGNTLQCPCFSCVFVKFSGLSVCCKFPRGWRCYELYCQSLYVVVGEQDQKWHEVTSLMLLLDRNQLKLRYLVPQRIHLVLPRHKWGEQDEG